MIQCGSVVEHVILDPSGRVQFLTKTTSFLFFSLLGQFALFKGILALNKEWRTKIEGTKKKKDFGLGRIWTLVASFENTLKIYAKISIFKFNFQGVPGKIREIFQWIRVRVSLDYQNQLRHLESFGAQFYRVSYLVAISEQVELPQPNVWPCMF